MLDYLKNDLERLKRDEKILAEMAVNLAGTRGAIQYCEHLIQWCENQYHYQPSLTTDQLAEIVAGPGAKVVSIDEVNSASA
jgi:hypothetical protein